MESSWIALAFVFGLGVRVLRLPPMVGFLATGFVLKALGAESSELLSRFSHLGVLLLLFVVGLKLRFKSVWRPEVWGGGGLHLLLVAGLAWLGFTLISPGIPVWLPAIALPLGFSSTVMAVKLLEDRRELRAFHGRVAIGILILQDLAAVALMSWLGGGTPSPWALALLALPLLKPLLHRLVEVAGHDELFIVLAVALVLLVGEVGFPSVGLSGELGALALGALIADHRRATELSNALWGLKEILLLGFFLEIGLQGTPDLHSLMIALALTAALPLKAILAFIILVAFRLRARSAFLTSLSLASYSEFALVVAGLAHQSGALSGEWLTVLAMAVALSFVVASPLNLLAHELYQRFEGVLSRFESSNHHPDEQPILIGRTHVLILGMGRVGGAAYDFLTQRHERVMGLDSDPGKVARHLSQGRRVLYADAEDPGLWHKLSLEHVRAVLLCMPDLEAKRIAAEQLRLHGFRGLVAATSLYVEDTQSILNAGADMCFDYFAQVGVGFGERVWEAMHPAQSPAGPVSVRA